MSPDLPVGTYQGTVELTDSFGNSLGFGETPQTLEIVATPPTFHVDMYEQPGSSLLKLNLNVLIPDRNASEWLNADWAIQWGDGSETVVSPNNGVSQTVLHYYQESGTFDVRLSINGEEWALGAYSTASSAVQELSSLLPESTVFNSDDLNTEVLNSALAVKTAEKTVEKPSLFMSVPANVWYQESKALLPLFSSEISSEKLVQDMLIFDSLSKTEDLLKIDELFWDDSLCEQVQKWNDDDSEKETDSSQQNESQNQTSVFDESFLDELSLTIL